MISRYLLLTASLWLPCALAQTALGPVASLPPPREPAPLVAIEPQVHRETDPKPGAMQIHLLPHFSTTIRMRDAVRSVVVGDPSLFWADHNDNDASLVTVHVRTEHHAQTNLEITTVSGQQAILWLISDPHSRTRVDFAVHFDTPPPTRAPESFWLKENPMPHMLVAETLPLGSAEPQSDPPEHSAAPRSIPVDFNEGPRSPAVEEADLHLDQLLAEQATAPLPVLYGQHPGSIHQGRQLEAGVSQVIDEGGTVVVLFSVVNPGAQAVALLPPQIQLGGRVKKKWTTAEQLPVLAYRLDRWRIGPGERANGVLMFERPSFKQSKELLLLQVADSAAVDEPALAPMGFGVSSQKGGRIYAGSSNKQ